jgi:hypothetical protein
VWVLRGSFFESTLLSPLTNWVRYEWNFEPDISTERHPQQTFKYPPPPLVSLPFNALINIIYSIFIPSISPSALSSPYIPLFSLRLIIIHYSHNIFPLLKDGKVKRSRASEAPIVEISFARSMIVFFFNPPHLQEPTRWDKSIVIYCHFYDVKLAYCWHFSRLEWFS